MVGRSVPPLPAERPRTATSGAGVELNDAARTGDSGASASATSTSPCTGGEIVGIAGVAGSGQRELSRRCGCLDLVGGNDHRRRAELHRCDPAEAIGAGVVARARGPGRRLRSCPA